MSFIVRGSSLPTFADCEGRWAVDNIPALRKQYGGEGRQGVGSIFGTLAHKAGANLMTIKAETGLIANWEPEAAKVQAEFVELISKGVRFDGVTGSRDAALIQLQRVIREFHYSVLPTARPEFIEQPFAFRIDGAEWLEVHCHPDLIELDGYIHDYKFSSKEAWYFGQAGTYIRAYESETGRKAKGFIIDWIRRCGESAPQADCRSKPYLREACLDSSGHMLQRMIHALKKYEDTRRPWSFGFNPNSKYCEKKICKAWGTDFCNQWIDKEK